MLVHTGSIFFSVMSGTTSLRGYCALTTKVKLRKYTGLQSSVWGRDTPHQTQSLQTHWGHPEVELH